MAYPLTHLPSLVLAQVTNVESALLHHLAHVTLTGRCRMRICEHGLARCAACKSFLFVLVASLHLLLTSCSDPAARAFLPRPDYKPEGSNVATHATKYMYMYRLPQVGLALACQAP